MLHPSIFRLRFCHLLTALVAACLMLTFSPVISAQEEIAASTAATTQTRPLSREQLTELETLKDALAEQREIITAIEQRLGDMTEGPVHDILQLRLDLAWLGLLEDTLAFSSEAAELRGQGFVISDVEPDVLKALDDQFAIAKTTITRTSQSVSLPTGDLSPTDQAIAYSRVFDALDTINRVYDVFGDSIDIARGFGLDVIRWEEYLRTGIADRAVNTSVFLEMSLRDVGALKAAKNIAPEDTAIAAALTEAERRLELVAGELERIADRMDEWEMDTSEYRTQILQVTGEISANVFELDVIAGLVSRWWANTTKVILDEGPGFLFQVLLFLIILYIARKFALVTERLVKRALSPSRVRISRLLENMIVSVAGNIVLVIGIMIGLSQLGISLGPLLAGLGIAGFIIGFALQDTLSNFASGMMILLYRPFDVGDFIESNGVLGKVSHMSLVNTTILTIDNQTIVLPNNMVWQNMIKNITGQELRRVDLVFGVSYSDDIPKVEKILAEVVASQEQVLDEPEPQIRLHELADSSVNFVVRPWVKTDDYWDVYWDLMRKVKMRFDEEGISIPFPQRDVHHYYESASPQPQTGG